MRYLLVAFLAFSLISCEDDNEMFLKTTDIFIGSWSYPKYYGEMASFAKVKYLPENTYGFIFEPNGTFIERNFANGCATPPVEYTDYKGTWKKNSPYIDISVKYCAGTANYRWKIVSLNNGRLKIEQVEMVYD